MADGNITDDIFGHSNELFDLDIIFGNSEVQQPVGLVRSHSVDELPLQIERERLGTHLQDNHAQALDLTSGPSHSCAAPVDLGQISPEMPLCLLEDDEENEIMKLLSVESGSATPTDENDELVAGGRSLLNCKDLIVIEQLSPPPVKITRQVIPIKRKPLANDAVSSLTRNKLKQFLYEKQLNQKTSHADSDLTLLSSGCASNNSLNKSNYHFKRKTPNNKHSYKKLLRLPQHPVTDYGAFTRERQSSVALECSSIQEVSKKLSTIWKMLSQDEKKEYLLKSQADQNRYISELKDYLFIIFKGALERSILSNVVDEVIDNTLQYNDSVMECYLCQLSFCNLYRKRSHFCGRPHIEQLVTELMTTLSNKCNGKAHTNGSFNSLDDLVSSFCTDHLTDKEITNVSTSS